MNTSTTPQNGIVKWFSKDKGFGFVVPDIGEDLYFNVRDVVGVVLPDAGDSVRFVVVNNDKGARAVQLNIVQKSMATKQTSNDRETCNHCGKLMVPRIILGPPLFQHSGNWTPVPKKSICPFCSLTHIEFSPSEHEKNNVVIGLIFIAIFVSFFLWNVFKYRL
jgi:cold shock CspA family protein